MKTPKKVIEKISLPLMFVTFVMAVLMFAVSPVSAAPGLCGLGDFCDQDEDTFFKNHKKCGVCGGETDCDDSNSNSGIPDPVTGSCDDPGSTPGPTTLTRCVDTGKLFCLASVDKWDRPAARLYVEETFGTNGSYTQIPPNVFGNILAALSDFDKLCAAYDVLIFQWKSPGIKNLTWQSLVNYMECGGGVVFEDPSNVDALWPDVKTTNIHIHSGTTAPITIAFENSCFNSYHTLCEEFPHKTVQDPPGDFIYEFDIENNHMEFEADQTPNPENLVLYPFLRLSVEGPEDWPIIGLYGEYPNNKGGRIVITGPDNSFHGNIEPNHPLRKEHLNQLKLLFNEIDWLLGF